MKNIWLPGSPVMSASPRIVRQQLVRRHLIPRQTVRRHYSRQGNTITFALIAMGVVAALSFVGWWAFGASGSDETPEFLTAVVSRGPYDFPVIEQGTVE